MQTNKGFSLVEMMITLAISAIIIGAAFGSYTIIARNYDWQTDMKYISQSARTVINMIQKDIRNAGFRFESSAAITDPVKIFDAGDCCDRIEIIYDETESPAKRVKIEYRLQQYSQDNTRYRLYKKKTNMTNNTVEYDSPIADYVEALQFLGAKSGCTPGVISYGCGRIEKVIPVSGTYHNNVSSICNDNVSEIFDGNTSTYWDCRRDTGQFNHHGNHYIDLIFAEEFRPTRIVINGSLGGVDGGSFDDTDIGYRIYNHNNGKYYLEGGVHPYGTNTSIGMIFRFFRDGSNPRTGNAGWKCVAPNDTYCSPGDPPSSNIAYSPLYDQSTSWLSNALVHSFTVKPKSQTTWDLETITSNDHILSLSSSNYLTIEINGSNRAFLCAYDSSSAFWDDGDIPNKCNIKTAGSNESKRQITIPDMDIYGETWSGALAPQEIELGLLLRSPNQHGNIDREYVATIVNHSISKNDKYLRDNYTTSLTMRNVYYQSQ